MRFPQLSAWSARPATRRPSGPRRARGAPAAASLALSLLVLGLPFAGPARAQSVTTARVTVERENFRREPAGRKVATVLQGASLRVLSQRDRWVHVELAGWLPADAVREERRGGFEWVVTRSGGARLLVEPGGAAVAELAEGFGFERRGEQGTWVRIRREGWLWAPSVELVRGTAPVAEPGLFATGPAPVAVFSQPDGDTVATIAPGAGAQVVGRTGDWYRVRVEGWVYGPAASDTSLRVADTGDLTPAQLRADPNRYRGALVRWRVQVVALRRAESIRTDFREGEPYLLARGPSGDRGFVYLAVPPHLVARAETVASLSYVTVVGRVRTGRSDLMGSPVIDLVDIEPEPGTP